ncbi:hypothetical protein HYE67_005404 [Fusarium culmorum]|uniref:Nephrocystin 3-like N-terminal domain-containing protein n=1 Tax=Fusarium culmorum TaxID=5516 RepID=A0A7S8HVV1_FUSCU|nr:hypothetical protein HYE67_005404 [Fusarium culmorum]
MTPVIWPALVLLAEAVNHTYNSFRTGPLIPVDLGLSGMRTRLKSPDLYTIGWITALPIELAAATALLDEHHVAPEGFEQRPSDTNSYTWGRICEHNVVIASLPAGVYGITSAATTALNLIHSFPHIWIGLLVGIRGGIARPDLDYDIRLGDVVVSQPDVIRGICDYADSHKNDRWQRYAAAIAAAFAVELVEYVPVGQLEATQKVVEVIQSLNMEVCNLRTSIANIGRHISLDGLPNAKGASFDSHAEEHSPTCLPGTRMELLKDINRWVNDQNSKTIFWLNGMAGTGKSTIARTIAQMRHKRGDLGASFFFKRGETDRGSLAKFVPTVARRLAWNMPEVAPFIKNAADADSAIADKAVREQFEKLVQEPLLKATATLLSRPSVVIVVNALDECERDADIKCVLELFSTLRFACFLYVRVLVTSRPELPSIIKHDIAVFLRHEFNSIRENFNNLKEDWRLPVNWPTEADLIKLTMAAVPLFIYAATICRFVNDSCLGNPDKLLQSVLHHTSNNYASKLDITYSPVLKQQVVNRLGRERRNIIESFCLIVSTIITLVYTDLQ